MIESCLYLFLHLNQVKYFATEARALVSPKITRHVHHLLGHCVVSSNRVLKYSNKATSLIANLLFLLKNVTHTAYSPSSSSTSISFRSFTIIPSLCFCPAPPIVVIVVVIIVNVVIIVVIVVYMAIAVAIALALIIDFNFATIAVIDIIRNWGAVVILLLLTSGRRPSGQPSGRSALAADAIATTANGHIIRASC
jgi:hypothetical protein